MAVRDHLERREVDETTVHGYVVRTVSKASTSGQPTVVVTVVTPEGEVLTSRAAIQQRLYDDTQRHAKWESSHTLHTKNYEVAAAPASASSSVPQSHVGLDLLTSGSGAGDAQPQHAQPQHGGYDHHALAATAAALTGSYSGHVSAYYSPHLTVPHQMGAGEQVHWVMQGWVLTPKGEQVRHPPSTADPAHPVASYTPSPPTPPTPPKSQIPNSTSPHPLPAHLPTALPPALHRPSPPLPPPQQL